MDTTFCRSGEFSSWRAIFSLLSRCLGRPQKSFTPDQLLGFESGCECKAFSGHEYQGVGETVFRCCVTQLKQERTGSTAVSKALTLEQQRIQVLEVHASRLEREKEILKRLPLS
ncbi:MAG: hypothetical protein OIF57_19570 [Marinobacterium sp.]|nr:hypothetical protein [Marinobacterium sp.]